MSVTRAKLTTAAYDSGDAAASRQAHDSISPEWEEDGHLWYVIRFSSARRDALAYLVGKDNFSRKSALKRLWLAPAQCCCSALL